MIIRKSTANDIDEIMEIYAAAREFMRVNGNGNQWGSTHPARELIEADIVSERSYVVVENDEIIGTFFFEAGEEKCYKKIYNGEWLNNEKYGVIHRIAMKYQGRGIATFVYDYCYSIIKNLKIDTHKCNLPMQKSLEKNGFKYCGVILLESGDERIAYQKGNVK